MYSYRKLKFEKILIFLFSILPIIDSINGLLIRSGSFSISMIYKSMMILILMILLLVRGKFKANSLKIIMWVLLYLTLVIGINTTIFGGEILELDFGAKIFFNVVILILLMQNYKNGFLNGGSFYKILDNNAYLVVFCILVPYFLGIGYNVYEGDIGYKALYYSLNELNAILIILFYFCIYKIVNQFRFIYLIQLCAIFVCTLLLNTKSSIIACILGLGVWLFENSKKKSIKYKLGILVLFAFGISYTQEFIIEQINSFMERQTYLYRIYGNSFFAAFTSGRFYQLKDALDELWHSNFFGFKILFGNGLCSKFFVEMDFWDIFLYFGLTGVCAVMIFLITIFYKSSFNFRLDNNIVRPFLYLLIIAFMCMSGHILFMATSGTYFVILCCFNMTYGKEAAKK